MEKRIYIKHGKTYEFCLRLDEKAGKPCFGVSAYARGLGGGQILDEIKDTIGNENTLFNIIYDLWKKYHLNDMHAGTEKQEHIINEFYKSRPTQSYDYSIAREVLRDNHCLIDNGYEYGTSWLYREIPQDDLILIKKLMEY